jgi:hypothetical protein
VLAPRLDDGSMDVSEAWLTELRSGGNMQVTLRKVKK